MSTNVCCAVSQISAAPKCFERKNSTASVKLRVYSNCVDGIDFPAETHAGTHIFYSAIAAQTSRVRLGAVPVAHPCGPSKNPSRSRLARAAAKIPLKSRSPAGPGNADEKSLGICAFYGKFEECLVHAFDPEDSNRSKVITTASPAVGAQHTT